MLEPLSPSHIPEKTPEIQEDKHLNPTEPTGDSAGYRFNFFSRSKKRKQSGKTGESDSSSVYNDDNAVNLQLSPEALDKIQRQRDLKKKRRKNQDLE